MTGMGVQWAPIAPERPRQQSDRAWIAAYQRRTSAARLRPYNRVAAAEVESQNATLGRAVQAMNFRAERRAVGRARVANLLADARQDNAIRAYQRDRYETLRLIERLGSLGRGAAVSRSRRSSEHTGADCRVCAEARALESPGAAQRGRAADYGEIYRMQPYCGGCGSLEPWCRCAAVPGTQW